MNKYEIRFRKSAQKDLKILTKVTFKRVIKKIKNLEDNPKPQGSKKLAGYENYWRIWVGNYRIIYSVQDDILLVEIIAVRHRKDAYD